jgi:F-type H+-transporting ATPase subunit gamma
MPSLIDYRRRIRAVKSTQQITKAMKMIAASRFRKAQERILGARPFQRELLRVIHNLASRVDSSAHPLLAERELDRPGARVLLIVVTADKGLCGGFNTNLIKMAAQHMLAHPTRQHTMSLVGRKGRDFFRRRGVPVHFELVNIFNNVKYEHALEIARDATEAFVKGEVDGVELVYNEFKSVMQQRPLVEQVLPIPRHALEGPPASLVDYLYEPDPATIFERVLPVYLVFDIFHALLESAAAEHGARMTAMDSASKNADEVIDSLTLHMNKVRQAAITREIIEVVSGAQAL